MVASRSLPMTGLHFCMKKMYTILTRSTKDCYVVTFYFEYWSFVISLLFADYHFVTGFPTHLHITIVLSQGFPRNECDAIRQCEASQHDAGYTCYNCIRCCP